LPRAWSVVVSELISRVREGMLAAVGMLGERAEDVAEREVWLV
jgi:hypothetical protein